MALLVAALAAALPLFLIVYVLKGLDLVEKPSVRIPTAQNYSEAIGHLANTSGSLMTISLTILGATVIWYLKEARSSPVRHIVTYGVFVGCVISIYFGVKLGYSAGLTISGGQPDIEPLLSLLRNQALAALLSGLVLTGLVVFSSLAPKAS